MRLPVFLLALFFMACCLVTASAAEEKPKPKYNPFIFKFDVSSIIEKMPPFFQRLLLPKAAQFEKRSGENGPPAADIQEKNMTSSEQHDVPAEEVKADEPKAEPAVDEKGESKVEEVEESPVSWTGRLINQGRQLATNLLSLSSLSPLLTPLGVTVDSVNQKLTVDTTAFLCALIVIFIPIIIGWLIIVYAWIIMSMVEFDYTVFGQFPRPLPSPPASSRMDILSGALKMFRLAYNRYMNADDPPVDYVSSAHPGAKMPEEAELAEYLRNPDYDPLKGHLGSQYFDVDDNSIRRRGHN